MQFRCTLKCISTPKVKFYSTQMQAFQQASDSHEFQLVSLNKKINLILYVFNQGNEKVRKIMPETTDFKKLSNN